MDAEQRAPGTPQWMAEVLRGAASQIEILGKVSYVDHLRQIAAYMEALAVARALTQAQPGWRDIESAPRDGTRIILAWPCGLVEQGFCLDNSKSMKPWAGFRVESMRPWPPEQPHKWMPLPAAPAPQQGDYTFTDPRLSHGEKPVPTHPQGGDTDGRG